MDDDEDAADHVPGPRAAEHGITGDGLVEVRPSLIAGRGLFATEAVAAGAGLADLDRELLNHCCDPNLGWTPDGSLVALRDVAADEELTVDYATDIDDPSFTMFCHCGTYRCRQVIEGTDWQIPQLQRRYAGHWAPALQRRIDRLTVSDG